MDIASALDVAYLLPTYRQFCLFTATSADYLAGIQHLETEGYLPIHRVCVGNGESFLQFSFLGQDGIHRIVRLREGPLDSRVIDLHHIINYKMVMPTSQISCPAWFQFFAAQIPVEFLPVEPDASVREIVMMFLAA